MNDDSSLYSMGQSSAAVAMANDAIANARRAAASSRMKRAASPSPPKYCAAITPASPASYFVNNPNLMGSTTKHGDNKMKDISSGRDLDLKHNDNSFHVIATLLTERLLPKIHASPEKTHYTMTTEDVAFFQKMLPYSMRRGFVDALRYRLQLMKMGVGSKGSELVELTMQCQKLGLERENLNVLFDLNLPPATSAGKSVSFHFTSQTFRDPVLLERTLTRTSSNCAPHPSVSNQLQVPSPCRHYLTKSRISIQAYSSIQP